MLDTADTPSSKQAQARPDDMTSSEKPVISLKDVHITLGQDASCVHVLKGISLDVGSGKSMALVGPSGSGKSTLLMVMAGLERPDQGTITISGTELTSLSEDELAVFRGQNIGIIFQSFHLMPTMTALENVALPLELAGQADAFKIAAQELENVGLGHRMKHYPAQLSGGEQQRVAIARSIAPRPKLLIADEPTGNLDDETGEQIMQLLFNVQKSHGTTLMLVTHDNSLAARANTTIRMRAGVIEPSEKG